MVTWKIIPNTNNRYKISNHGEIYSNVKNRKLKGCTCNGHVRIRLYISPGKYTYHYLCNIVYKMFVDDIKNNHRVYHIDGDIHNNNVNNLLPVQFSFGLFKV